GRSLSRLFRSRRRSPAVQAGPVGLRLRLPRRVAVCRAALPVQDRDDPPRGSLAAESSIHRVHVPRPATNGLGAGPRSTSSDATSLVLSLDGSAEHAARGGCLRADSFLLAVCLLARRLEPVRTTRFPVAGAVLLDVIAKSRSHAAPTRTRSPTGALGMDPLLQWP